MDAYALVFRAYYALIRAPRMTSKGMNVSAIFGFVNILNELVRKEKPDNICVVFDPPGGSFRRDIYPEYKANRDATPEDIKLAVPYIKRILDAMSIKHIVVDNYEADDVIGTLSKRFANNDSEVYMVTSDKDYCQLIDDNIYMYKHVKGGKHEIVDTEKVLEKYKISNTLQIIDLLALWGDSADNVPGAKGVGEVTASKLISQFESVEGLLENTDKLKGKQKENIESSKDNILLSKDLVTIRTDVDVELSPEDIVFKKANNTDLISIYKELEFNTLIGKLKPEKPKVVQQSLFGDMFETPQEEVEINSDVKEAADINYELIKLDKDNLNKFRSDIKNRRLIVDTEVNKNSFVVSVLADTNLYFTYFNLSDSETIINDLLNSISDSDIVVFNLKEFLSVLKKYGVEFTGTAFDIELAHYVVLPEQSHSLRKICSDYAGYTQYDYIFEENSIHEALNSLDEKAKYSIMSRRVQIFSEVSEMLKKEITDNNQNELYFDIELPLVRVLSDMEHEGVRIDVDAINNLTIEYKEELSVLEKRIFEIVGHEFNLSSPKQLGPVLFDELGIEPKPKKTKSGQYATGEEVLIKLKDKYEVVELILEHRSQKKLISTYLESLPKLVSSETGKIHTTFNQTNVSTGRLSSSNPNLQNIPIKSEKGRKIREVFIPEPDHQFLSADYSQVELRLMAHFSEDEDMIKAFTNNEDIHATTASKIFGVEKDQIDTKMRIQAKVANFSIIYGVSAFGLSQNLNIPRKEAKDLIDNYFAQYPKIRDYMDNSINIAKKQGYISTIFGRRRYLSDINSSNAVVRSYAERNAVNSPIQGTAADIIKIAMNKIHSEIKSQKLKSKMLFQVHDELNFSVPDDEVDTMKKIITECMENSVNLSVPLLVESGSGTNWNEAH